MRNIAAERRLLEKLFFCSGWLILLGILFLFVGAEIWLIFNWSFLGIAMFLILQGLWGILFGTTLALMANLVSNSLDKKI